jgi:hypothetical protein
MTAVIVLLVPLVGGVAVGGPENESAAKQCAQLLGATTTTTPFPPGTGCIEDQAGNQYNFTNDAFHHYLFGTMTSGQECDTDFFYITGSYGFGHYEITGANPLGDQDSVCITTFKIKGVFPHGAWYYTNGYGAQRFRWKRCGTSPSANPKEGGTLRSNLVG